jgi:Ca-activated chloride channel family protein
MARTRTAKVTLPGIVLAFMLSAGGAAGDGLIVIDRPPGGARPPHGHSFAPLEVREHHVSVTIVEQIATTRVDQTFFNPTAARLEGTYLFPIPKGAQIDTFEMEIGGSMVRAELLDAARARSIYEDIVRRMRDPALLEYVGQSLFKVRIFPIEPHSEKRVRLSYTELLRSDSGMLGYVYPLNTERFSALPLRNVSVTVEIKASRGLRSVFSPSHEVEVRRHGNRNATVGFEAREVRPDTDFQLYISTERRSEIGLDLLTFNEGEADGGYFLLLASPADELRSDQIVEKDVVLVLDTSGSMADGGKLEQARKALRFCLANLGSSDHFELVRFSTEAESLFGRCVPNSEDNRERAERFVAGLRPIGGTAIEEALVRAISTPRSSKVSSRPLVVVFLTDGKPTIGSSDEQAILAATRAAMGQRLVRVFCFGIGTDINTHLLDRIADETRAASQYVLPNEDLELKVSSFYAKISQPVLANPSLQWRGAVRISKTYPGALPDLFRGEQLVIVGRYDGNGDATVSLGGTVNGTARSFTAEVSLPRRASERPFIAKLWATRRVGFLLDQIRLHGDSKELRDEVAELARRYGIVTPYTAYLIVEDEAARNVPMIDRTLQVIGQSQAANQEMSRMYEQAKREKSGDAAVGNSLALKALSVAQSAAAPAAANKLLNRGQTGAAAKGAELVEQSLQAQATRFVNGRTFYQNGNAWIDERIQKRQNARRSQVQFGSPEYFELVHRHPEANAWFALGRNVQVVLSDAIVEITE